MTDLIVTEKPKSAMQIAAALADGKPIKKTQGGVSYYEFTHGKTDIIVASAVGHIYGLAEKNKKGWRYPVFETEWLPLSEIDKKSKGISKYITVIKKLAKDADHIIVATDYDIEGEVIGLNIVRYAAKRKDAERMKYSTLTKPDLREAYEHRSKTLDWGQAKAGETRHILDWYYGINLSRALTTAVKTTGGFKLLSSGRVQGPALQIIVEREKEIAAFKADPYWDIELKAQAKGTPFIAEHKKQPFWKKDEAQAAYEKAKGHEAKVESVKRDKVEQAPPHPFDLTSLQLAAYKALRIPPNQTLDIAQQLYTSGYISYPRTSSQQLPPSIGYKRILTELAKQPTYAQLAATLLKGELKPNNGKKTDPAHPALYPTGIPARAIEGRKQKVYDLITRRFLATFAPPAERERQSVLLTANGEPFTTSGSRTIKPGWHTFYGPFLSVKETELPPLSEGENVKVLELNLLDKETQPPKRYSPASIIKELEKRNLGTKATRASIVETLYHRGYVDGQQLTATDLGMQTVQTLSKYAPEILDEELTRQFEESMEKIRDGTSNPDSILSKAKDILTKTLAEFKKKEKMIGSELQVAHRESEDKQNTIGTCPRCKEGTLMIRRGKFGRFIACTKYPDCEATYKLPAAGMIKPTTILCEACNSPKVLSIRKGKRPQELCINLDCPTKKPTEEFKEHPCPKCSDGTVVLRRSIYGSFAGCNKFPKCRYIQRLNQPAPNQNAA